MRNVFVIIYLFFSFSLSIGQTPVGSWSDHLVYNSAKNVAVGREEVFASNGSSVMVYNKKFAEIRKLSRINGLTETGISTIAWSDENDALIIGYSSTNIDIIHNNIIYNIPDISRKYIPGKKEINRIRTGGKYAYLACSFGIVVVDITKKEIYDTWKPGTDSDNNEVWDIDIEIGYDKIYAATNKGIYSANLSDAGLSYFGNWTINNDLPVPQGKYTSVLFTNSRLYVNRSSQLSAGDSIYVIGNDCTLFSYIPGVFNTSFDPAGDGFTVSSPGFARYYLANGSLKRTTSTYGHGPPNMSQAIVDNNDIWIADLSEGLFRGIDMSDFTPLTFPGPASNNAISITSLNGQTIICRGSVDNSWNNLWLYSQVSVHESNSWILMSSTTIWDAMRAAPDPGNSNHLFISTWGSGLLEYENNILINQYNETNSPLQTIIPGKPYVRICGLAMDKNKYLWITQTGVPGSIKVLKPDGTWIVYPFTIEAPTISDLIITKSGHKWIVLPRGYGLFVLDDNNTPENFSDDRYRKIIVMDTENQVFSSIFSIAEDLDGNIWIGTDQGPLIYYNPDKVFDGDLKAFRIKIPRNDGTGLADYMLGTETITSIAIDGANRKWLGTFSSGAYLLSSDGTIRVKNFNEENSPLFSNSIVSLAVDNKSGDIWFGTSKGIMSVRGDATSGQEKFINVYAFPNPVREDFTGNVTITGLMRDSQIIITDVSGNFVFKTVSDGGSATWDLKTYNGRRVATGVYMVFCASSDGSQAFVTKILIIR
jgi:hypothetical protein